MVRPPGQAKREPGPKKGGVSISNAPGQGFAFPGRRSAGDAVAGTGLPAFCMMQRANGGILSKFGPFLRLVFRPLCLRQDYKKKRLAGRLMELSH